MEGTMWREQCGGNSVEGTMWREQCGGINMEGTMWREPCGCGGSKRTWTKTQYSQIHRSVNSATGNNCTDTAVMCDWFSGDHSNCRYYSLESSHVTVNTKTTHPQHAGISQPTYYTNNLVLTSLYFKRCICFQGIIRFTHFIYRARSNPYYSFPSN